MRSEKPVSGKTYRVRCVVCEQKQSQWVNEYAGTINLAYHAITFHRDLKQVQDWMASKKQSDAKSFEDNMSYNNELIEVCLPLWLAGLIFVFVLALCSEWKLDVWTDIFVLLRKTMLSFCCERADFLFFVLRIIVTSYYWIRTLSNVVR